MQKNQSICLTIYDSDLYVDEVVGPDCARSRLLNQFQVTCRQSQHCSNNNRSIIIHLFSGCYGMSVRTGLSYMYVEYLW